MKLGAQRLLDALLKGLAVAEGKDGTSVVPVPRNIIEDLVMIMRSAAKQDERSINGPPVPPSRFEGYAVVAWLRHEACAYKAMADGQPKGRERATATAFSETCRSLAEDLASALELGGGTPIDPNMPRRFRRDQLPGPGIVPERAYGTYFPGLDASITNVGLCWVEGKPEGVDWLDPEP